MARARYDGVAAWYQDFRPSLTPDELDALRRLLGPGSGSCLDVGCGTGLATAAVAELGWSAVGVDVSADLLEIAHARGLKVIRASADAIPLADESFDAAISVWTHTDVDDFPAVVAEVGRILRPGGRFLYLGAHPCFVGPHSSFQGAEGVPGLHEGYSEVGRYDASSPGVINPDGVRARVGAVHLPLGDFVQAFADAGLRIERFEELGERDYPYVVALRARR